MKNNNPTFKIIKFGELIKSENIYKSYAYTKEELELREYNEENTIPFVSRTELNNCVDGFAVDNGLEKIEAGNAIVIGDTTATVAYQKERFITGDHIVVIRADWLNEYTGLYIVTLLNKEKFRYSYGRAFLKDTIYNTKLKIPFNSEGNPDFEYMEKFIKRLKSAKITTKNKISKKIKLDVNEWKEYNIPTLFDVNAGIYHYKSEYDKGFTPYISATNKNNGVTEYIDLDSDFSGNVITTEKINCMAFFQKDNFCATSDVNILRPKFQINIYIALFISSVINYNENYRWNYGRQCRVNDTKTIKLKLPSKYEPNLEYANDEGYVPDFEYMENYIKSLPYGDRI